MILPSMILPVLVCVCLKRKIYEKILKRPKKVLKFAAFSEKTLISWRNSQKNVCEINSPRMSHIYGCERAIRRKELAIIYPCWSSSSSS